MSTLWLILIASLTIKKKKLTEGICPSLSDFFKSPPPACTFNTCVSYSSGDTVVENKAMLTFLVLSQVQGILET